jgi:hypothetical protein
MSLGEQVESQNTKQKKQGGHLGLWSNEITRALEAEEEDGGM